MNNIKLRDLKLSQVVYAMHGGLANLKSNQRVNMRTYGRIGGGGFCCGCLATFATINLLEADIPKDEWEVHSRRGYLATNTENSVDDIDKFESAINLTRSSDWGILLAFLGIEETSDMQRIFNQYYSTVAGKTMRTDNYQKFIAPLGELATNLEKAGV